MVAMSVICDDRLGSILAYAPNDLDDVWPCLPVADLLDREELDTLRTGFWFRARNMRRITSRAYGEGGSQERELAEKYRSHAKALHNSHPYLAATMEDLAK